MTPPPLPNTHLMAGRNSGCNQRGHVSVTAAFLAQSKCLPYDERCVDSLRITCYAVRTYREGTQGMLLAVLCSAGVWAGETTPFCKCASAPQACAQARQGSTHLVAGGSRRQSPAGVLGETAMPGLLPLLCSLHMTPFQFLI